MFFLKGKRWWSSKVSKSDPLSIPFLKGKGDKRNDHPMARPLSISWSS
jgi:hypothetical protein